MSALVKASGVPVEVATAVAVIRKGVIDAAVRRVLGRLVCEGCRCLCLPDEQCPGCRAKRQAVTS